MRTTIEMLDIAELNNVVGGTTLLQNNIALPHIPKASELLTPAQIQAILSVPLPLPVPHG